MSAVLAIACACVGAVSVQSEGGCPSGASPQWARRTAAEARADAPASGSNYPGVSCASDETCDEWICRQSCSEGEACPEGTACDEAAGFICRPTRCGNTMACPLRYGCAEGNCIPVGRLCSQQSDCGSGALVCVNGACASNR